MAALREYQWVLILEIPGQRTTDYGTILLPPGGTRQEVQEWVTAQITRMRPDMKGATVAFFDLQPTLGGGR